LEGGPGSFGVAQKRPETVANSKRESKVNSTLKSFSKITNSSGKIQTIGEICCNLPRKRQINLRVNSVQVAKLKTNHRPQARISRKCAINEWKNGKINKAGRIWVKKLREIKKSVPRIRTLVADNKTSRFLKLRSKPANKIIKIAARGVLGGVIEF